MKKISRNIDVWDYDLETDILFFRHKSLKYHSSIDMGDMIIDIATNGDPIGVELLNASKKFGVSKITLRGIKGMDADINVSKTDIKVTLKVFVTIRNAQVEKVSVAHGINDINLQTGQTAMVC
jgi:uncharacterized protein YuzE